MAARTGYGSLRGAAARGAERDGGDARRRSFANWYFYSYPAWPGYGYAYDPYLMDWGFYDWGEPADSDQGSVPTESLAPYPDYGATDQYAQPEPPWSAPAASAGALTAAPEEPLTVIFKSGRAPVKMQNYMMTAKVLTDLDSRHYEQIPMDEIDLAATQQVNAMTGVEFQIPKASRD